MPFGHDPRRALGPAAGDTHTGTFAAALARAADALDAARVANAAAALSVTRRGPASAPSEEELERFLAAR